MLKHKIALAAAASMAATPCLAADMPDIDQQGARRSGAAVGAYLKVPLGERDKEKAKARAGLRVSTVHDYRSPTAPAGKRFESDAFDLRLVGPAKPTLYISGRPVTGEEARKHKLAGATGILSLAMTVAAIVGAIVIYDALKGDDDDDDEDEDNDNN